MPCLNGLEFTRVLFKPRETRPAYRVTPALSPTKREKQTDSALLPRQRLCRPHSSLPPTRYRFCLSGVLDAGQLSPDDASLPELRRASRCVFSARFRYGRRADRSAYAGGFPFRCRNSLRSSPRHLKQVRFHGNEDNFPKLLKNSSSMREAQFSLRALLRGR